MNRGSSLLEYTHLTAARWPTPPPGLPAGQAKFQESGPDSELPSSLANLKKAKRTVELTVSKAVLRNADEAGPVTCTMHRVMRESTGDALLSCKTI